jgi:hypothetical protein
MAYKRKSEQPNYVETRGRKTGWRKHPESMQNTAWVRLTDENKQLLKSLKDRGWTMSEYINKLIEKAKQKDGTLREYKRK